MNKKHVVYSDMETKFGEKVCSCGGVVPLLRSSTMQILGDSKCSGCCRIYVWTDIKELQKTDPKWNVRFWYVDDKGIIRKLLRCQLCRKGPFRQDEVDIKFVYTDERSVYCTTCSALIHPPKVPKPAKVSSYQKKILRPLKLKVVDKDETDDCDHLFKGNDWLCSKCGLYYPETTKISEKDVKAVEKLPDKAIELPEEETND